MVSYLGLKFENSITKQCKIQKLRLIEPDDKKVKILNNEKEEDFIDNFM